MRYLPPAPLSAPAGPASSKRHLPYVIDIGRERAVLTGGRHIDHEGAVLRVEERHEINRVRIRCKCLIAAAGLEHRLKHQLIVHRGHAPDDRLDGAPLEGAAGEIVRGKCLRQCGCWMHATASAASSGRFMSLSFSSRTRRRVSSRASCRRLSSLWRLPRRAPCRGAPPSIACRRRIRARRRCGE